MLSYSADETAMLAATASTPTSSPTARPPPRETHARHAAGGRLVAARGTPTGSGCCSLCTAQGVPVRAWGRGWSHHPVDRLRTWRWARPDLRRSGTIPRGRVRIQAEGLLAVNAHGDQAGLSMRTFEVPGMAGLQAVDREDVSRFYDVGTETLVYRTPEELAELAARAPSTPPGRRAHPGAGTTPRARGAHVRAPGRAGGEVLVMILGSIPWGASPSPSLGLWRQWQRGARPLRAARDRAVGALRRS
ncbi:glycosyltransferase [Kocuria rhizophila]|nr:glycosyltransferase [Kocuria rhizophila]